MPGHLHLFGIVQLVILAAVLLFAAGLAALQGRLSPATIRVRIGLAVLLFLSSAMYYGDLALHGQLTFPDHLPLELCDASLTFVIIAVLTLNRTIFDLVYYPALAGASMSLLTPTLTESSSVYLSVQFFLDHGLIVATVLYLVWTGQARPRPWSVG